MVRNMVKVSSVGTIKAVSLATSLLIKWRVVVTTSGQMVPNMTENGLITSCMGKVLSLGTMGVHT